MLKVVKVMLVLAAVMGIALAQDGEIVVAQRVDVPTFDVHQHSTTAVEAVLTNLFDYLIFRDVEGVLQPALATSWESIDTTSWRIVLREGVTWHDGEAFDAEDVKYTLERVANDVELALQGEFETIASVDIVSDVEVIIRTAEPDPLMLSRLSRLGASMLPEHYIREVGIEEFSVNPIGTGPYQFVEWIRDDRVVLEAYADHWRGAPAYERVVFRAIPEDSTRVSELISGGVDIAMGVPAIDVPRIESAGGIEILPTPTPRVYLFLVNTGEDSVMSDPLIREAVDYAIDEQIIIDTLFGGFGTPTLGRVTPGINAAPLELYGQSNADPERARELLAEAGYGSGELTIKLQGPTGRYPQDAEMVEVIAVLLEDVGINTEVEILEWSAYLDQIWSPREIVDMGFIAVANSMFDGWHAQRQIVCEGSWSASTNWCHERFTELVNGAAVELDLDMRAEMLSEAYYIVAEERPMIFMHQLQNLAGIASDVSWTPRPDELLWMFDAQPQ
ncbi:MAG: ABC transporter substrate-binding protein [Deinococcota bacterium]